MFFLEKRHIHTKLLCGHLLQKVLDAGSAGPGFSTRLDRCDDLLLLPGLLFESVQRRIYQGVQINPEIGARGAAVLLQAIPGPICESGAVRLKLDNNKAWTDRRRAEHR